MNKNLFLGLMLIWGCFFGPSLAAESTPAPYYLTLSEAYGRPFESQGYSGPVAYGLGSSLSFENRAWDYLSVGVVYDHLSIIQHPARFLNVDDLDLMARIYAFRGMIEPYALFSAGMDTATSAAPSRDNGYHGRIGAGLLFSLTDELAVDLGGSYQVNGPADMNLNYGDIHVGLQLRLGSKTIPPQVIQAPAPTPCPTPAAVTAMPAMRQHVVKKNEDLFGIARLASVYGDGFLWPLLYDANKDKIRDARRIEPGMVLNVPDPGNAKQKEITRARARANWNKAQP